MHAVLTAREAIASLSEKTHFVHIDPLQTRRGIAYQITKCIHLKHHHRNKSGIWPQLMKEYKGRFILEKIMETYWYTRFRWWKETDLDKIAERMRIEEIKVVRHDMPSSDSEISPYRKVRDYLYVKADTLEATISPLRATLSQRSKAAFTKKDMKLRRIVLDKFPHNTSSPFPWAFSWEPSFEVKNST